MIIYTVKFDILKYSVVEDPSNKFEENNSVLYVGLKSNKTKKLIKKYINMINKDG